MREYESANALLPCPADATLATSNANFGVAATKNGYLSTQNCGNGGTVNANYIDSTNNVAIGAIPVHTLGLSNDYALDAWGRMITYAVDTRATACFYNSFNGNIQVTDNGMAHNTVVALVSHGPDGFGAFIPTASGTAVRYNSGSSDTNQLLNAHITAPFTPYSSPLITFMRLPTSTTFERHHHRLPESNMEPEPGAAECEQSGGLYYLGDRPVCRRCAQSHHELADADLDIPGQFLDSGHGHRFALHCARSQRQHAACDVYKRRHRPHRHQRSLSSLMFHSFMTTSSPVIN